MFDKRRMHRLFRSDRRTLIVAMDHRGYLPKDVPELADPAQVVRVCVENGADAVMVNAGTASRLGETLGPGGLVLSVAMSGRRAAEAGVEQALRLGADALKVLVYPFRADPEPTLEELAWLGARCQRWGLPLLAETVPGGWQAGSEMRSAETVAAGARVAAEAGADFVKTFMVEGPDRFRLVTADAGVPVVILGGETTDDEEGLLETVRSALDQGAAGVAMGRNIWAHSRPGDMVAALAALIHEDASVDEALKRISG